MRALVIALLALAAGTAHAYPQFQLSKDQTCSGCHLSPAGGGPLSENGLSVAGATSQWGTAPEFMYGALPTPSWLTLGGDLRGAGGFYDSVEKNLITFPMQAQLDANAAFGAFSVHVAAGARDPQYQNTGATLFSTREHWLQWQQQPGGSSGLFVRVGRFMPVFGLRFVEHPDFTRRYGGSPLYGEAYGAAVEYIDPRWEVHATGFIHDPFFPDSIERGNGAAVYAEARPTQTTAVGVEMKLDATPDDRHIYTGVTAKQWLASPGILIQGEVQLVHQKVALGGTNNQLVGYVMGSYFLTDAIMIDLGLEAYAPDLHVRYLDQEGVDLNVHWFTTSHLELILTNHFQMQELGEGGVSSGYSLLQLHYRL
jgi:hypothetical protein